MANRPAPSIFVSYRRLDTQYATFAIVDRLRWAFGVVRSIRTSSCAETGHSTGDAVSGRGTRELNADQWSSSA
jgi:hypothetical protein